MQSLKANNAQQVKSLEESINAQKAKNKKAEQDFQE